MASKQLTYEEQWLYIYLTAGKKTKFSQQSGKMTELFTKDLKYCLISKWACECQTRVELYITKEALLDKKDCRYVTLSTQMQT